MQIVSSPLLELSVDLAEESSNLSSVFFFLFCPSYNVKQSVTLVDFNPETRQTMCTPSFDIQHRVSR